ncbi:MAG: hypothetical protein R6U50_15375, partial [Desulfobacterales bacterium]
YNEGSVQAQHMTEEFFDYVYLGRGDIEEVSEITGLKEEIIEQVRRDFEYWYPLNLNRALRIQAVGPVPSLVRS